MIEAEADRLTTLVGDLLDFSRINSGTMPLAIEPNEAEDLLGAALQQVTGAASGRTINVGLDPAHPLLFGRFDFTHTLRVLVNLIENALKYSTPDTAVDLSAKRDGPWLSFAVADRGYGVAEAERERIFDPFYSPRGWFFGLKKFRLMGLGYRPRGRVSRRIDPTGARRLARLSIARGAGPGGGARAASLGQFRARGVDGGGSVFTLRGAGDRRARLPDRS